MLALRKLRSTQWTGLRVLAAVVIAAGLFGTASGLTELIEKFGEGGTRASNPVVDNDQRRHAAMLENQVKDYPSNLAALSAFSAFVALVTLHFVGLAWRMFAKVPLSSIMGGLFLSASGICGLLVAPAVARVNEFAFQAVGAQPAEREWLQGGMAFLNQLHLIFITGWLLFLGLGWVALGLGAVHMAGRYRLGGCLGVFGAVIILVSVGSRYWLPTYGATVPVGILLLDTVFSLGIAMCLVSSGLLTWMIEGENAPRMRRSDPLPL